MPHPTPRPAQSDALTALWNDSRKKGVVDFARLHVAVGQDESGLAGFLAKMAEAGLEFSHDYKTGARPDADDAAGRAHSPARRADVGAHDRDPNGALRQEAEDLLPWASRLAEALVGNGLSAFDLVQEGALGLAEGLAKKWEDVDFAHGVAVWCEYRMLAALAGEPDWIVYPAAELALVDAWLRAKRDLAERGATRPTDGQLAEAMGRPEADAAKARAMVAAQAKTGHPFQIVDQD